MEGGLLGGLARTFLGGESLFFQKLTAQGKAGEITLAPTMPGDISAYDLCGDYLNIVSGGFLAAEETVDVSTKMQNLGKGFFSGAGLCVIKVYGKGKVFFNSFGAIYPIDIPRGEEFIVDTGHLVAWEGSLNYSVEKAGSGWMASLTSGEMLVCKFKGPGRVYTQSRNPGSFGSWVNGLLPQRESK